MKDLTYVGGAEWRGEGAAVHTENVSYAQAQSAFNKIAGKPAKVWVFTFIRGGILDNLKIVPEDMEKELLEYAAQYCISELGDDPTEYDAAVEEAWAKAQDAIEDSEDFACYFELLTIGNLSDD
jgi:hypothetical protein